MDLNFLNRRRLIVDIYTLLPSKLLFAEPKDHTFNRLRDVAQELEGLGLAGLCAGDHIVHYGWELPDHQALADHHPDIFTCLTATAAVTSNVKVVSRIVVLPYRQPFAVAHAIASLVQPRRNNMYVIQVLSAWAVPGRGSGHLEGLAAVGPGEGLGRAVVFGDPGHDRGYQLVSRAELATAQQSPGQR